MQTIAAIQTAVDTVQIMLGGRDMTDKGSLEIERALVAEAQGGDNGAFEELVRKHSEQIYRISLRLLRDPEDAKDNLQNTLCKAYVNLAKFQGNSRFSTWLVRIAINEGLMTLRSRRSELAATRRDFARSEEEEQSEIARIRDARPSPERICVAKDLVAVAFRGVRPLLKEAFMLHSGAGWTNREVADEMGITEEMVKSHIFRTRVQLRQRLQAASSVGSMALEGAS
jgi:RNA polymerase sigma-70 factor (ECF subfamily)